MCNGLSVQRYYNNMRTPKEIIKQSISNYMYSRLQHITIVMGASILRILKRYYIQSDLLNMLK